MNRKRLPLCEQDEIRIIGRKLAKRLAPEDVQRIDEKADEVRESFNSRKLKAWHMVQEAVAAGDLKMLKTMDKLTVHYDRALLPDGTADFMERSHRNDILEEEVVHDRRSDRAP